MAAVSKTRTSPRQPSTKPTPRTNPQYFSRAVAKAFEVMDLLAGAREPQPLQSLARRVRLTKTSLFRLLYTLDLLGYVDKHADGRYGLRRRPDRSGAVPYLSEVLDAGTAQLRKLTREFRETSSLALLFDNHIEVIAVVESPQTVRMGNTVGRILQPHASSLGKSITAFQPEERREHLIRSYGISPMTQHTIIDETRLHKELARVREQGYATDREETCLEGFCFGAPVLAPGGYAIAALSISVPRIRLGTQKTQERLVRRVREAAAAVTAAVASRES